MARSRNNQYNCTKIGGQYIILSSIFAAVIAQEIESIEDLELLAAFLVAVADELALAIIARTQCEAKLNGNNDVIVEIVLDKDKYINQNNHQKPSKKNIKKVVKRVKVKKHKDSKKFK